jgi:hypothetical protein
MTDVNNINDGQRLHVQSMVLSPDSFGPGLGNRVFFDHIPVIEVGQLIGLFTLGNWNTLSTANISNQNILPVQSNTMNIFVGFNETFITIVNKKGQNIFSQIPYSSLYPLNGKVKPYNAVNIDSRKSYIEIAPGSLPVGPLTFQIAFIMKYQ